MSKILASRTFAKSEQINFADLCGDSNPMHVDFVAARRVGAGAPVVHGVHNLLWCLDRVAQALPGLGPLQTIKVSFDNFVTVNERVDVALIESDPGRLRVEVLVRGCVALTALLTIGDARAKIPREKPEEIVAPFEARTPDETEIAGMRGRVPFATLPVEIAAAFPNAARLLGARGVAALGACTRLIGMACPGRHSIFSKINLEAGDDDGANDIGFRVTSANLKYKRVVCSVWGGGWIGTLTSMMRAHPVVQPSINELAPLVRPGEFRGTQAFVVGGSRGIGEVVAKLIAAGGGRPIITYTLGEIEAIQVATDICHWGGACDVMKLDVNLPLVPQFAANPTVANQLFYFATPMIECAKGALFEPARLDTFLRVYVTGFYQCCQALRDRRPGRLDALYPSSIFLEKRPHNVTEYAMAKAAGEHLCQDMNDQFSDFRALVCRLPRLATDQNSRTAKSTDAPSIWSIMLPLMRAMG